VVVVTHPAVRCRARRIKHRSYGLGEPLVGSWQRPEIERVTRGKGISVVSARFRARTLLLLVLPTMCFERSGCRRVNRSGSLVFPGCHEMLPSFVLVFVLLLVDMRFVGLCVLLFQYFNVFCFTKSQATQPVAYIRTVSAILTRQ
jgi:hypothetical protein